MKVLTTKLLRGSEETKSVRRVLVLAALAAMVLAVPTHAEIRDTWTRLTCNRAKQALKKNQYPSVIKLQRCVIQTARVITVIAEIPIMWEIEGTNPDGTKYRYELLDSFIWRYRAVLKRNGRITIHT